MSGVNPVNPSISNKTWWDNPVTEPNNQPQSPSPLGFNAAPISQQEAASQQSSHQTNAGRASFQRMLGPQQSIPESSTVAANNIVVDNKARIEPKPTSPIAVYCYSNPGRHGTSRPHSWYVGYKREDGKWTTKIFRFAKHEECEATRLKAEAFAATVIPSADRGDQK